VFDASVNMLSSAEDTGQKVKRQQGKDVFIRQSGSAKVK
jgi:hypothetical protein